MEQHEHDEQHRNSQLISRTETIKIIKAAFCQENAKLKYRSESDQKLLGNFMSVVESALLQDVKGIEIKAVDANASSAQLVELFTVTGCINMYQVIKRFKELDSHH